MVCQVVVGDGVVEGDTMGGMALADLETGLPLAYERCRDCQMAM